MSVNPERFLAELERMRQLILADPEVRAQFDTDGNGVIEGDEWHAVEQLVHQRLEREAMEAEIARLWADIEADEQNQTHDTYPTDEIQLAFDPHAERIARRSAAEEVFHREVVPRVHEQPAPPDPRLARPAQPQRRGPSLGEHRVLVLEQIGGIKQLFGNLFKREYVIKDRRGQEIGHVHQRQNEALQDLVDYSIFKDPDLGFIVRDDVHDLRYEFIRSTNIRENTIQLKDPRGRYFGYTTWTLSFIRRKYEVRIDREQISYYVVRRLLKPWTFDILDPFEEPIGTMERGWAGFGFLAGANIFRIELDAFVSHDTMLGLLATALLADLDSEQGSRRAGLDIFNS